MADRNEKVLLELLKRPGNNICADCGSKSKISEVLQCNGDIREIICVRKKP